MNYGRWFCFCVLRVRFAESEKETAKPRARRVLGLGVRVYLRKLADFGWVESGGTGIGMPKPLVS